MGLVLGARGPVTYQLLAALRRPAGSLQPLCGMIFGITVIPKMGPGLDTPPSGLLRDERSCEDLNFNGNTINSFILSATRIPPGRGHHHVNSIEQVSVAQLQHVL